MASAEPAEVGTLIRSYTLQPGQRVWVAKPGTYRSHIVGWFGGHRVTALVDADQLEWPGPSRPELLTGPDWL